MVPIDRELKLESISQIKSHNVDYILSNFNFYFYEKAYLLNEALACQGKKSVTNNIGR